MEKFLNEINMIKIMAVKYIVLLSLLALIIFSGCEDIFNVDSPSVIQPDDLNTPPGALTLYAGAKTKFYEGYMGTSGDLGIVGYTAGFTDELTAANRSARGREVLFDRRDTGNEQSIPYTQLQQARINLLEAINALERNAPNEVSRISELYSLIGFIEVFFGESYCSGVPLSGIENGQPVFGEQLTTSEILERAIEDFDRALAIQVDDPQFRYLALVGKSRALINLGRFQEASDNVSEVPTDFEYRSEHSSDLQRNYIYEGFYLNRYWSVSDNEGINGYSFLSSNDPRIPTEYVGLSTIDNSTSIYAFAKYNSPESSVLMASGIEARLIEAENYLQQNENEESLKVLNDLRSALPGLTPLSLQLQREDQINQLFRERAFWLYLTGHRHSDMRRLVRQYGRSIDEVFPTGAYEGGGTFQDNAVFTPGGETPNPNYQGCLDNQP